MRQHERPARELFGPGAGGTRCLRGLAQLIHLDRRVTAALGDVVRRFRVVDRREGDPGRAFEPFAGGVTPALGLAHLADRLVKHQEGDAVFAARITRGFEDAQVPEAGDLIEQEQRAAGHFAIAIVDGAEQRADDDPGETGMVLQRLQVEIDEDVRPALRELGPSAA